MQRSLLAAALAALSMPRPATAEPDVAARRSWRTPSLTVSAGALLPALLVYENPGPMVGASLAWTLNDHVRLVASLDAGAVMATGTTRVLASLGGGVRLAAHRRVPVWLQLGLGVGTFVERIGVVLPERTARVYDGGLALTTDVALGFRLGARWELALAYDRRVLATERDLVMHGDDTLAYDGTLMIWIGRRL